MLSWLDLRVDAVGPGLVGRDDWWHWVAAVDEWGGGSVEASGEAEATVGGAPVGVVQRFLLRTSVLDELEPGACAAVTGHDDAATFLRRLETSALFVVPTRSETYRYHQLIRDMLRYQLRAISLDGALDAHRHAAEWYESRGMFAAALSHLVAAGQVDRAYELLQAKIAPR